MSSSKAKCFVILTGPPGVGKTTVVQKVASKLKSENINVSGFYTEEVRDNGIRTGFDVVTLKGLRAPLARASSNIKGPSVGKYTVLLNSFENAALGELDNNAKDTFLVIDEIGKMEMFSTAFKNKIAELLKKERAMLSTIPIPRGNSIPLLSALRSSPLTQMYTVTPSNRDTLPEEICNFIRKYVLRQ